MAINKVVYGGNTLIDLSSDTVVADKIVKDYTAHDKAGNTITGTLEVKQGPFTWSDMASNKWIELENKEV